jgi:dTDP-4-dehydrorhamnose reductase
VTGAGGQLGAELVREFANAGDEVLALARPDFDVLDAGHVARIGAWRPDVVVNAAAWTDVDGCARDPERAMRINGHAAGEVAAAAAEAGALAVQVSTNEVFDGRLDRPYSEDDVPAPINPYGAAKLAGERLVSAAGGRSLIVRTAWLYGDARGFPARIRAAASAAAAEGRPLRVVDDEWGNPTPAAWLAGAIVRLVGLVADGEASDGIYHLAGWPPTTRYEWARALLAGSDVALEPIGLAEYSRPSRVPPRAVLDVARSERLGIEPGSWSAAAER